MDINMNIDIFQILNKNIIYIIEKIAYYFLIESLIIKNKYLLLLY
jgi:hypothetical protein